MEAQKIYSNRFSITCKNGLVLAVFMDLYKLPEGHHDSFPEGYKFSWIAFDPENPSKQVLLDCHVPKGPHFHTDQDPL